MLSTAEARLHKLDFAFDAISLQITRSLQEKYIDLPTYVCMLHENKYLPWRKVIDRRRYPYLTVDSTGDTGNA